MKSLNPNLLVVDDEPSVRTLLADVLRMKGYQPRVARHAVEALEMCLREGAPDLLVSDIVMPPHYNGVELAQRLRVLRADMKVLYVSAYAPDSAMSQAFGDPLSDFLPKPLSPIVLAQTVEKMLDGTPGAVERDARRRRGTVLMMISDPGRRQIVKECLERSGAWVLDARHPTEAQFIGRWNEGPINLLLMDVPKAAGKGGWLRRLQHARPDMRTIFVEEEEERFRFTENSEGADSDFWSGVRKLLESRVPAAVS
jgi:CheY-like chemotaxis protein